MVKNSANAGDMHGFNAWSRKIPHAVEQLCPCATTTEACMPILFLKNCSRQLSSVMHSSDVKS